MTYSPNPTLNRLDYRQDWLDSGVDDAIIDLNVEAIAGADLFEVLYPHPQRLNAGRLNAKYLRLWERCVDFDNTPLSHGWICNGRVKILEGPLLKPENGKNGKWKVVKYRNPEGSKAPLTFLKVPLHIWEKVAARYGIAMPSYIEVTQEGSALGFWAWVLKNRVPVKLTEGEKKAGCLLTLGYAAIALPGISMGWRVTEKDSKGKAIARELHPDLQPFDDGREILIAFDYRPGDYFKSPEWVNAAILGKLFKKSTVKIARLPGPQKGIDDFAVAGGDVAQVLAAAESLKQLQDEKLWRSYKGFSPDRVVNQRYLDIEAPEHGKATLINSGLGTGKTQYLADKIAPQPGKQINIGYRNSLLLQMAQKIGSYHLDEHDGRRFLYDPNARISLCWDSLLKLPPEIFEGADIILDEASSSLKHLLTSSTCKEKRVEILEFLKKIAPNINRIIATDGNNSDLVANWVASVFKLPIIRIKNNFKGDTPPVTFLELPQGRSRIAKSEFEYLAKGIMGVDCPAIATDSLNDAEALYKMFTAQGKKGILLSSKTATKKWAKEFLANPDAYIRKHKPQFIIFTPTAESGLDISIKEKIDNLDIGNYFSDVFCIFRGVIGVDECLQMSRRVRHPERIVICCAERKFASNNDSNPFSGQLIKDLEERVTAEMKALSPEENTAAIKEAIKAQIDSPHLEAWAKIKGKDAVEGRNLRRFLLKAFEDGGYEVNRISFSDLLNPDAIYDEGMSFADAKKLSKEEEAKQIFNSEFITLEKYLEIEGSNAEWEDCCKAIKYRLLARLPGIENTELWTWEFVYRIRFTDRDLLNQLYANWKLENPIDAELLQRQKWNREFRTFLPDLNNQWLKLKLLSKLGINQFLDPSKVWTDKSPEVKELVRICKSKSAAALLGHPGKSSPMQYLNRLLKFIGVKLKASQVREGDKRVWQYRFVEAGENSSRPENWDELYPLVCQKMAEKIASAKMAESPSPIGVEVVTAPPLNIQNTAEAVTENQTHPVEKVWGVACEVAEVAREVAEVALWVARGMVESAKTCLHDILNRYGYLPVAEALESLSAEQRLAVESLG